VAITMAKKKKEVCPYCGGSFTYLSRHKCKVKERVEGPEETTKTESERRTERIEERKKETIRTLKKEEKTLLDLIKKKKNIYFNELLRLSHKNRNELDDILDVLALQSKIKVRREMVNAAWTKFITFIDDIELEPIEMDIDLQKKDFILDVFAHQPCLICPFTGKCNETNIDQFNPKHCPWLSEWIDVSLEGKIYQINFDEFQDEVGE
jgi:hypothetical protein